MYTKKNQNHWVLFLFLAAGMVLGACLSRYLARFAYLAWLDFGLPFGLTQPVVISLGALSLTFGFELKITIGSLIGMALSIVAYKLAERL